MKAGANDFDSSVQETEPDNGLVAASSNTLPLTPRARRPLAAHSSGFSKRLLPQHSIESVIRSAPVGSAFDGKTGF